MAAPDAPENLKAVVAAIGMSLGLVVTAAELATARAIATSLSSPRLGCCFCTDAVAASLHRTAIAGIAAAATAHAGAPLAVACAGAPAVERSACRLAPGLDQLGLSVAALIGGEAYHFERQRFETAKATHSPRLADPPSLRLAGLPWPEGAGFAPCDPAEARRADLCYGTLTEFAHRAESAQEPSLLLLDDAGEYLDASVRRPAVCTDAPGGFYLEICPVAYLARYRSLAALLYS